MKSPSSQEIELRAYELWENRGRPWGTPDTDWFNAEHELTAAEPGDALAGVARKVGTVLGTVVALAKETLEHVS